MGNPTFGPFHKTFGFVKFFTKNISIMLISINVHLRYVCDLLGPHISPINISIIIIMLIFIN